MNNAAEKRRQESYFWHRLMKGKDNYLTYNTILASYMAKEILVYAKGGSLLDLACGDGYITKLLSPKFKRIVGVEASSSHLKTARKILPKAEFHESLIEDFQTDEKFDCITMNDVLEHLRNPRAVLKKVAHFLKPKGFLMIQVPNANAINRRLAVLMGTLKSCTEISPYDISIGAHRRSYTLKTLKDEVKASGLAIKAEGGIFYKILSTAQMNWFLKHGLWQKGGFGWGRIGGKQKDWRKEFCRASYELGKSQPEDCNIIYVCATLR